MTLKVCTWNIGDGGSWADLQALMDDYPVIGLQEMSDRQGLIDKVHNKGWKSYDGGGDNGRAATPLIWDPDVMGSAEQKMCVSLSPKKKCKGTGPDTVKAKWLVGIGFNMPKVADRVRVWTMHAVSDSSGGCRKDMATQEFKNAAKQAQDADGPCIIVGDMNTAWNSNLLDPFRNKGWKPSQGTAGGPRTTHGQGWEPDQHWYRNCKPIASGVRKNGSDHHAYWVEYEL